MKIIATVNSKQTNKQNFCKVEKFDSDVVAILKKRFEQAKELEKQGKPKKLGLLKLHLQQLCKIIKKQKDNKFYDVRLRKSPENEEVLDMVVVAKRDGTIIDTISENNFSRKRDSSFGMFLLVADSRLNDPYLYRRFCTLT